MTGELAVRDLTVRYGAITAVRGVVPVMQAKLLRSELRSQYAGAHRPVAAQRDRELRSLA